MRTERFKYLENDNHRDNQILREVTQAYSELDMIDLQYLNYKNKMEKDYLRGMALRSAWSIKSEDGENAKKEMENRMIKERPTVAEILTQLEKGHYNISNWNSDLAILANVISRQGNILRDD